MDEEGVWVDEGDFTNFILALVYNADKNRSEKWAYGKAGHAKPMRILMRTGQLAGLDLHNQYFSFFC